MCYTNTGHHLWQETIAMTKQDKHSFSSLEASLFWSAPRIATSGKVQHRKKAIHGLPVTLRMPRVKSDKSDRLRIPHDYYAQAQKIGPSQRSVAILGADQKEGGLWGQEWIHNKEHYAKREFCKVVSPLALIAVINRPHRGDVCVFSLILQFVAHPLLYKRLKMRWNLGLPDALKPRAKFRALLYPLILIETILTPILMPIIGYAFHKDQNKVQVHFLLQWTSTDTLFVSIAKCVCFLILS